MGIYFYQIRRSITNARYWLVHKMFKECKHTYIVFPSKARYLCNLNCNTFNIYYHVKLKIKINTRLMELLTIHLKRALKTRSYNSSFKIKWSTKAVPKRILHNFSFIIDHALVYLYQQTNIYRFSNEDLSFKYIVDWWRFLECVYFWTDK